MINKMQYEVLKEMLEMADEWNCTCPNKFNDIWNCVDCWSLFPKSKCRFFIKHFFCTAPLSPVLRCLSLFCPNFTKRCPCQNYNKQYLIKKVKYYVSNYEREK